MFNFRTDLADERADIFRKSKKITSDINGIETDTKEDENIKTTTVKITNENGEKSIGKPIGTYVTIDIKQLKDATDEDIQVYGNALSLELKKMVNNHIKNEEDVLIVGLGNIYVTPDSLGPKVINEIDVTRHIIKYMPQYIETGTRPISAVSPGVLGTTGIETLEIIDGIVKNINPKLIIVIDALASRSMNRISSSIQLSDTGIVPGAGVDNTRKELSEKTLGVPVIAIGIPTVVEAATIVADSIDVFIEKLQNEGKSSDYLNKLKDENKYKIIKEVLIPKDFNMIVTPKEIDDLIENMKDVVAIGINSAL